MHVHLMLFQNLLDSLWPFLHASSADTCTQSQTQDRPCTVERLRHLQHLPSLPSCPLCLSHISMSHCVRFIALHNNHNNLALTQEYNYRKNLNIICTIFTKKLRSGSRSAYYTCKLKKRIFLVGFLHYVWRPTRRSLGK